MKEFLLENGTEVMFFICATVVLAVLFICITIGTINGNEHYYDSMNRCTEVGGTWIPTNNVGVCIASGVRVND